MELYKQPGSLPRSAMRQRTPGFTLIELLIVLVIAAIGIALSVPTFRAITEKRQLTSAAESVAAFINFAQSAAVKYDRDVVVNMQRSGFNTWCVGAKLDAASCDCTEDDPTDANFCEINGVPRRIQHLDVIPDANYQLLQSIQVNATASANSNVIFDPVRGTLLNLETVSFEMHTSTGSGSDKDYQVNVNLLPTGNVSLCTATGRKRLLRMFPTCSL